MKLLVIAAVCVGSAAAANISYSNFSSVAGLTLNGNAAQAGNALRVAPSLESQAGTAYYSSAIGFDALTAFSTSFEFNIATDPDNPTDGFTFLLQNQGVNALGGAGQGSGYVGISPSVAVLFRGRGPAFIGVVTGGIDPLPGTPAGAVSTAENAFYNQNEFAWIDYNPITTTLSVYLNSANTKPGAAFLSSTVDVAGLLGSQAYVGFSAGTGGGFGNNDILNWSFASAEVPEPATTSLFAFGLALLGIGARRFTSPVR